MGLSNWGEMTVYRFREFRHKLKVLQGEESGFSLCN